MQVDFGADLSTPALAASAGMSPSHFHEVFRRATGETVKQYTLRLRLERAAFRLLTERWCAATTYVGPFSGLASAYETAFRASGVLRGFDVVGLPVEERYLTSALLTHQEIQTTQILIPLRRTVP